MNSENRKSKLNDIEYSDYSESREINYPKYIDYSENREIKFSDIEYIDYPELRLQNNICKFNTKKKNCFFSNHGFFYKESFKKIENGNFITEGYKDKNNCYEYIEV